MMFSLSELWLVQSFNATVYETLRLYLTALPEGQCQIDINAAPPATFLTMDDKIKPNKGKNLFARRKAHGIFSTVAEFMLYLKAG